MKNENKQERVVTLRLEDKQLEKCVGGGASGVVQTSSLRYQTVSAISARGLISSVAEPF